MADISLTGLQEIDGFIGCSLIDTLTGFPLASTGTNIDSELHSIVGTDVYRSVINGIDLMKMDDYLDDLLISLGKTYQLIRPLDTNRKLIFHLALDRNRANLALAKYKLQQFENTFDFSTL